jgi:hypothetical protein
MRQSSVLWAFDPRVTALARPRSNYVSKLQTRPLVREGTPQHEEGKWQTVVKVTWGPTPTRSDH